MSTDSHPMVQSEIEKAKCWVLGSRKITDGISFTSTNRLRIGQSYMRLSIEHQLGLLTLMELGIHASAKALLRPQFDAFVRGIWFVEKATDEAISRWSEEEDAKGIPPIKYRDLIAELATIDRYADGSLDRLHAKVVNMLHDFTHGGKRQIGSFNTRDEIKSNFSSLDIIGTLRASASLGWLAVNEMVRMCGLEDRMLELESLHRSIYGDKHGKLSLGALNLGDT